MAEAHKGKAKRKWDSGEDSMELVERTVSTTARPRSVTDRLSVLFLFTDTERCYSTEEPASEGPSTVSRPPIEATDRLQYLRELSQHKYYVRALRLLDYTVSCLHYHSIHSQLFSQDNTYPAIFIPATWSRWTYDAALLPKAFYSKEKQNKKTPILANDSLYKWADWLKASPWLVRPGKMCTHESMEQILLGLGLALRALDQPGASGQLDEEARNLVVELSQQLAKEAKRCVYVFCTLCALP